MEIDHGFHHPRRFLSQILRVKTMRVSIEFLEGKLINYFLSWIIHHSPFPIFFIFEKGNFSQTTSDSVNLFCSCPAFL